MREPVVEADYMIIGAGACAMSFADVILTESQCTVAIVDRHAQPGGHWNEAYPFVRLHQPSAYYGVSSRALGRMTRYTDGLSAGSFELATGHQVLVYLDEVMREQFLPTGRVTYLPMSEYLPDGTVVSTVTGKKQHVVARRRVVDARYLGSVVPSTHAPSFHVADGVGFVPINGLGTLAHPHPGYVIYGAGKTGVDACLWLLERGVDPAKITWVRPRDSWFHNRVRNQPDHKLLGMVADLLEAGSCAESVEDLVARLEQTSVLLRIDSGHWPTMFRQATMSEPEVEQLRRIEHVVRLGYVTGIEPEVVHLDRGELDVEPSWLHVDCTAEGLRRRHPIPIFQRDRITLQFVVVNGLPTYSAAIIAKLELSVDDDAAKNLACPPIPITGDLLDIATNLLVGLESEAKWGAIPALAAWMASTRLNPLSWALADVTAGGSEAQQSLERLFTRMEPALANLRRILAGASDEDRAPGRLGPRSTVSVGPSARGDG